MKMIDVLNMMAKGEINNGTILTVKARNNKQYKYIKNCFLDDYNFPLNIYGERDLNSEVIFIEPKPKKYYLRLCENFSNYVNRFNYLDLRSYTFSNRHEFNEFQTKFTQEEIDNDKFLKFVEQHGIKEEVEENEDY